MYSMDNDIDHILVSEDALKAKVNELGAQSSCRPRWLNWGHRSAAITRAKTCFWSRS